MTQPHQIDREAVAEAARAWGSVEKIADARSDLREAAIMFDAVNRSRALIADRRPAPEAVAWRMKALRDMLLAALVTALPLILLAELIWP